VGQRGQRLPPLRPATPRLPITERCRSQRITPPKQPFSNPVKRQSTRRDRSPQSPRKTLPPNRQHNPTLSKTRPKTTLTINGPHTTPNPTQPAPDTHQPSAHWLSTRATPHPSRTAPNPSHPPIARSKHQPGLAPYLSHPSPHLPDAAAPKPSQRPGLAPRPHGSQSEPPAPAPNHPPPNSTQPAAPLAMRDPAAGATMCA
jgi:hypothetical protein